MRRALTKSRFKLAVDCPTKLFYTGKPATYADQKLDDDFLIALAEGGYQVGELAKCYYPAPPENDIDTLDHEQALERTRQLLSQENVIIYEAAFSWNNLFIRADILVKEGRHFRLIEVKSKCYNKKKIKHGFYNKQGTDLDSKWKPYLYDVAFQKYVMGKDLETAGFQDAEIAASLMLADKEAVTSIDGLNEYFLFDSESRRVIRDPNKDYSPRALGERILIEINVDAVIADIRGWSLDGKSFEEAVSFWSESYLQDARIWSPLTIKCAKCEFRATAEQKSQGFLSGYEECWTNGAGFTPADFEKPHVFDIWNFRKKGQCIRAGKYFQEQITSSDLQGKTETGNGKTGLNPLERQLLQISKTGNNDREAYVDKDMLKREMEQWKFPLHHIDFETCAMAIPFHRGMHPYESVAFQFSHHVVMADGTIEHRGQWIDARPGVFPNFDFVRALKQGLEQDGGTIFRYAAHENTILNQISDQLQGSEEPDSEELCDWIATITQRGGNAGPRNMVDLCEMVKRFYYHMDMRGSNSIKAVLPAILNNSPFLQQKYGRPIYGVEIKSLNFNRKQWIEWNDDGTVKDPYKTLPPIFSRQTDEQLEGYFVDEELSVDNGGAAMTAYAKMQFTLMSDQERERFRTALLKYCELDTLAMVMVWEELNRLVRA
jgi:hypothetical protein